MSTVLHSFSDAGRPDVPVYVAENSTGEDGPVSCSVGFFFTLFERLEKLHLGRVCRQFETLFQVGAFSQLAARSIVVLRGFRIELLKTLLDEEESKKKRKKKKARDIFLSFCEESAEFAFSFDDKVIKAASVESWKICRLSCRRRSAV